MNGKLISFLVGLYIGKYYHKYVPFPELTKENINKGLQTLEKWSKDMK
jgi:hypothetical protein